MQQAGHEPLELQIRAYRLFFVQRHDRLCAYMRDIIAVRDIRGDINQLLLRVRVGRKHQLRQMHRHAVIIVLNIKLYLLQAQVLYPVWKKQGGIFR